MLSFNLIYFLRLFSTPLNITFFSQCTFFFVTASTSILTILPFPFPSSSPPIYFLKALPFNCMIPIMHCLYQSNCAAEYPALQSLLLSTTYSFFPPFPLKYAPFHHTTFIALSILLTEVNPPARTDCVFVLLGDTNVFFMHGKCKCVYTTGTLTD